MKNTPALRTTPVDGVQTETVSQTPPMWITRISPCVLALTDLGQLATGLLWAWLFPAVVVLLVIAVILGAVPISVLLPSATIQVIVTKLIERKGSS